MSQGCAEVLRSRLKGSKLTGDVVAEMFFCWRYFSCCLYVVSSTNHRYIFFFDSRAQSFRPHRVSFIFPLSLLWAKESREVCTS